MAGVEIGVAIDNSWGGGVSIMSHTSSIDY